MGDYFIGIDLGGTNIKGALLNEEGDVRLWKEISTEADGGVQHVITRVSDLAENLCGEAGVKAAAAGIGLPAMLDLHSDRIALAPNLKWKNIEIKSDLERRFGMPVLLENDGSAAAKGEAWLGAGKNFNYFMLVTIGTGIGSGLIINGRVYRGFNGYAPEMGHMTILPHGPKCECGKRGCLESLVSAPAICERARKNGFEIRNDEVKKIFDIAENEGKEALDVIDDTMEYLSVGITNVIVLIDPAAIIIGGGVAGSCGVFLETLKKKTISKLPLYREIEFLKAELGNKAGAIGAARLAMENRG